MEMAAKRLSFGELVRAWLQTSRIPFLFVGICPFVLGTILAYKTTGVVNSGLFVSGLSVVVLIMLATYYIGEYCDITEDRLSATMERNAFSGGAQVIAQGVLPHEHGKIAGYIAIVMAGFIGVLIYFYYGTGVLTIPLGLVGAFSGFFYSKRPFRWVERGIGEILIGICYGWLPVAVAFYIQTGYMTTLMHLVTVPIACTIFNVILINEFPDYPADLYVGKKNLTVRFGKRASSFLYIIMTLLAWTGFSLSVSRGLPGFTFALYAPVFLISFLVVAMFLRGDYLDKKRLEAMCGMTIVVNLATTLVYIAALLLKG